jgi:LysR family nitrogen assimilation transcriptional regulator
MSVDFTKLKSFVKIVDAGSVSRAASILRTAQPALSQQVAALESHFKHKLLTRSNTGITPTEAGLVLYRHAQMLLKQIEQAKIDIDNSSKSLAGRVSIGLATYSTSSALSLPILPSLKQHVRPGLANVRAVLEIQQPPF